MRSLTGLVFLVATLGSHARTEEPTEWIHAVRVEATAGSEEKLARACDERLAQVLRAMVAPRVLWRRTEPREAGSKLVARVHAVVSTASPLPRPVEGVELLSEVGPGRPLTVKRDVFSSEDRSIRVPTEALSATSLSLARRRADLLQAGRERVLEQAAAELARRAQRTAWKRADVRPKLLREEGDEEVIVLEVRVEAVYLIRDPACPPGAPVAPTAGLAGALDRTPADHYRRKKHGGH